MKLIFIANSRIPTERAMGTAIMKQCEAFAKAGITVELVVPRRCNSFAEDPFVYHRIDPIFKIRYLPSFDLEFLQNQSIRFILQKLTFFVSLSLYIWKSDADILYSREPELIGPLLTKKKKFVELHHLYGLRLFGKYFLALCAGVLTITNALKEDVVRIFSIPITRIHVAPSGVDLSSFQNVVHKEATRAELGIVTTKPVALYIGSLEEWKGYDVFLKAGRILKDEVHFVVIGGNAEQVLKLKLKYPEVQFLGPLPQHNLPNNQQVADVLVVPNSAKELISARHTSPLKVFAHMTSGIPIVASSTDAIQEVLSSENAILVTPDSPEALAKGVLKAINGNSATIAMQAKEDVKKFDWSLRTKGIILYINEFSAEINS